MVSETHGTALEEITPISTCCGYDPLLSAAEGTHSTRMVLKSIHIGEHFTKRTGLVHLLLNERHL